MTTKSEAAIQNEVRVEASQHGLRLWRNNVGVLYDEQGRPVRYGLCNESKRENQLTKSADLIGIRPVKITQEMVGQTVGIFCARECKHGGWIGPRTPRELAQQNFIDIVNDLGGDASFVTGHGSFDY